MSLNETEIKAPAQEGDAAAKTAIDGDIVEKATALRRTLHRYPELSGRERGTKARLIDFIKQNTALEICDMGAWFYCAYRAPGGGKHIAFRADMDALPICEELGLPYRSENPGVSHKCGHDGHSAALAALSLAVDRHGCKNTVFFLFQHAEETGAGANECAELMRRERVDEIYGWHNMPGFPLCSVAVHTGVAACASKGLILRFRGKNSHASQPENGLNPVYALGRLIGELDSLTARAADAEPGPTHGLSVSGSGMVMCTVVGAEAGSREEGGGVDAFGTGAGFARLMLTVRAEDENRLCRLEELITLRAEELAAAEGMRFSKDTADPFPETRNDPACAERVRAAARELGLSIARWDEPFRSSEDFGVYTKLAPGALFYVGCGENHAPLHTAEYDFEDELIPAAAALLYRLAR